jgi:hypothetical protein
MKIADLLAPARQQQIGFIPPARFERPGRHATALRHFAFRPCRRRADHALFAARRIEAPKPRISSLSQAKQR